MASSRKVFIPKVKSIRSNAGLSIRQLAANSSVDRTKISRWERGQGLRMIREAVAVAKTLGTSVEDLFSESR